MASIGSILKHMRNFRQCHFARFDIVESKRVKYGQHFTQSAIEVEARPIKRLQGRCPMCVANGCFAQRPGYDYKRQVPSKWRTINCFGMPTYLCYRPQRIKCPFHGIVTEYIPWADGDSRFTSEFNDTVTHLAGRMSISDIAEIFDISWETVGNCVRSTLARIEPDRSVRLDGLTSFCVDETSIKKGYKYLTVVYDMIRSRVVWIGTGVGDSTYKQFVDALTDEQRAKVVLIAGDGARWIDRAMDRFPNATRAVDPFHVVGWIQDALDLVRKDVTSKANSDLRKYQSQCDQEIKAANEAAAKLRFEIEHTKKELAQMPTRGRESKRKKELKAYLNELEAQQKAQAESRSQAETPIDPPPTLTEEERHKLQAEYDSMPKKGRRSKRKIELERLLGIQHIGQSKKQCDGYRLTPEQEHTLEELKQKASIIKGARFALYHNPENTTANQSDKLKWIQASCPDLYLAYQLKEQLRAVLHMTDADTAQSALNLWIENARASQLKPMVESADKIQRHTSNILNSIRFRANSARSESCNATIKAIITMGRGFSNVENLMSLIYYRCSDLEVPLINRPYKTAEYMAEQRERARLNRIRRKAMALGA